jgi:hypothetical protein|tara:strand:- start:1109 stop:1303 length:195 start_codon:yes stop_codon:yes gene_type:complete
MKVNLNLEELGLIIQVMQLGNIKVSDAIVIGAVLQKLLAFHEKEVINQQNPEPIPDIKPKSKGK